jgi:hypothetical protein
VVHPDGTGFRLVVAGSAQQPAWSPDSSQIVYVRYDQGGASTLRLAAADGSSDRELPLPVVEPFSPTWR